jgi:hypothetical protein
MQMFLKSGVHDGKLEKKPAGSQSKIQVDAVRRKGPMHDIWYLCDSSNKMMGIGVFYHNYMLDHDVLPNFSLNYTGAGAAQNKFDNYMVLHSKSSAREKCGDLHERGSVSSANLPLSQGDSHAGIAIIPCNHLYRP